MKKQTQQKKEIKQYNLKDIKTAENKFKFLIKWAWYKVVVYFKPFIRPSFLVCFGCAWFATNGIFYVGVGLGYIFHKPRLVAILLSWCMFLWLPTTCEGLITIPLALFLHSKLFKNDLVTKRDLERMYKEAIHDAREVTNKVRVKTDWYNVDNLRIRYESKLYRIERRKNKIQHLNLDALHSEQLKDRLKIARDRKIDYLDQKLIKVEKKYYDKLFRKNYAKSTYDHYKELEESVEAQNKGENDASKTQNDISRVNTHQK